MSSPLSSSGVNYVQCLILHIDTNCLTELGDCRKAIDSFRNDSEMIRDVGAETLRDYKPRLSFVACVKGHHVRLFEEGPRGTNNMAPGTVVDTGITDARWSEAYLASHKALIGTTRPTRYVLLVDENQLT